MKRKIYQIMLIIIYLLIFGGIIYFSLQNGTSSNEMSNRFIKIYEYIFNKEVINVKRFNYFIRKILGHYGSFFMLGIFSSLLLYSIKNIKPTILIIINFMFTFLFAVFTEFVLQNITSGRNPNFKDVLIDYAGFITSALIITIVYLCKVNTKNNKI